MGNSCCTKREKVQVDMKISKRSLKSTPKNAVPIAVSDVENDSPFKNITAFHGPSLSQTHEKLKGIPTHGRTKSRASSHPVPSVVPAVSNSRSDRSSSNPVLLGSICAPFSGSKREDKVASPM